MAAPPPPPPPRGGLSLYDNLPDPNDASAATISSAPVLYNQTDSTSIEPAAKKAVDPSLRFQPIRRPQVKQAKAKPSFPKTVPKPSPPVTAAAASTASPAAPQPKTTLADWAATEEDEWQYGPATEKRQRGGRKKKKKQQMQVETDWNDLYDPTRPTNVDEYLRSDEKVDEVREWKALLYRHRRKRDESYLSDDDDEDSRPVMANQFAPPPAYSAVPPPPPPQSPPAPPPDDKISEDTSARRQAMAQAQAPIPPPPPPPEPTNLATISRAPVRYTQPLEPKDEPDDSYSPPPTLGQPPPDSGSEPRSMRPGQAGFAHRLMSKYGWTKGTGLGADESGIINPLRVQVEKRRKKADADGGGWADPANKAKIIGGKRKEEDGGKFGVMSEVIVLQNMLENLPDLEAEIADGLGQEIGEECGEKYGRVERLYIEQGSRQVFIKFTNQVSALRAVNELDGRVFNGNTILPKFYDTEKFEKGVYN
ncbi:Fc.00g099250.m01.CDS01 [Cosmosporella sp. VM-42]